MRLLAFGPLSLMGCLATALMIPVVKAEEAPGGLLAAAHAQDITPLRFPISVNGSMSDQKATSAHDALHARCIVLKQSKSGTKPETILALVVCDSCMIPRELVDRAKALASTRTGIPTANILISATHAHSCPTVTAIFQSDPDADYVDFLVEQIAKGIENAHSHLEPARIGWGSFKPRIDQQSVLLFNRRWKLKEREKVDNPFGLTSDRVLTNPGFVNPKVAESTNLIDPELSVLSIQSREGRPIALLANYSLHYVGGVPGNVVSADYFGEFAERTARRMKGVDQHRPFVAIMSNGTSGDVNNVDFRQNSIPAREPFEQINFVAEMLSQEVVRVCEQIVFHTELPLAVRETDLVLDVRKPTADEVSSAEQKLSAAGSPVSTLPLIYARETILLSKYPGSVPVKLQCMKIGSLAIAACPCETFTETGLAIKKGSPFAQTFTISMANGYNGYLPPPEQHSLGGYETWRARSSYLATDAEPKIRASMFQLLSDLNK